MPIDAAGEPTTAVTNEQVWDMWCDYAGEMLANELQRSPLDHEPEVIEAAVMAFKDGLRGNTILLKRLMSTTLVPVEAFVGTDFDPTPDYLPDNMEWR